jgi:cytochrome c553
MAIAGRRRWWQDTQSRRHLGVGFVVSVVFVAACGGGTGVSQDVFSTGHVSSDGPGGDATVGLETYRTVGCSACHGGDGEGGIGPALAGHTEDQIFRQVRTPKGDVMPPFPTGVLSDEDVKDIYAWVETLGGEMAMAPHGEEPAEGTPEGGDHGPEMTPTEAAHLRLMLVSIDTENPEDAVRHIEHVALHGGDPELLELTDSLLADLAAGDSHAAEQRALAALGPDISEKFDVVTAHIGMALSSVDRGDDPDVEYHLAEAANASVDHDHGATLQGFLDDWRSGEDRHAVIDALYGALDLEHPPH